MNQRKLSVKWSGFIVLDDTNHQAMKRNKILEDVRKASKYQHPNTSWRDYFGEVFCNLVDIGDEDKLLKYLLLNGYLSKVEFCNALRSQGFSDINAQKKYESLMDGVSYE